MRREVGDTWIGEDGTEWTVVANIDEPNAEAIAAQLAQEAAGAAVQ